MEIHKGLDSFEKLSKAVITTGTFDGVHLGHQKLLNTLIKVGKQTESETVIVTFFPHPRIVLFPEQELKLINTMDENIAMFKSFGINHLIFQNFDQKFSRITSLEYTRNILLQKIGLKDLIIGYNHHFGRNREGSIENLNEFSDLYDFNIHEVGPHRLEGKEISSTKIRNALNGGHIDLANQYLGYSFKLSGIVEQGNRVGTNIGFPTANVRIENSNKIVPKDGVYAVKVHCLKNCFLGMLNIGFKPTFNTNHKSIEVHIFDFSKNIYNEKITIEFIKRIRNEKKFPTVDQLKSQLVMDKITVLNIFNQAS